ncbi:MAG: D-alanyl-D-alanine carboxypeptidase [Erysipelotrichaceae bacterium]|nr:D-alanyl-D-alanine carboxypeptidase [Erysipelotrichaceae bacterium]
MKKLLILFLLIPFLVRAYSTSATSAILMDLDSGRIIYANNKDLVRSVASISKIMTAVVAIESDKLDEIVTVGSEIKSAYGSGIYIKEGEELTLRDLLYGLMLRSGNDAALSIATYVGGDVQAFVSMMNAKAKSIGMKNSTFNNPSGLDQEKGNYSSAYDMALLMKYAYQLKEFREIVSTKKYELKTNMNYYLWNNKNKLLYMYKYANGGKTGFTEKARRTLVTTASKNNTNLVAVTLNDGNDFLDHKALFEEAFGEYNSYQILNKDKVNIVGETFYKNAYFYLKKDFTYLLKKKEIDDILIKYNLDKIDNVQSDTKVGGVKVYFKDKVIYTGDVFIKVKKEKKSFWKVFDRLW